MTNEDDNATTGVRQRLLGRFRDPEYRHAFVEQFLDSLISTQIRDLRKRRGWSQNELAEKMATTQSAVSRLERPDYSAWSIRSLRKLAEVFDVALSVRFVGFGDAVTDIERLGVVSLVGPEFSNDPTFREAASGIGGEVIELAKFRDMKRPRIDTKSTATGDYSEYA